VRPATANTSTSKRHRIVAGLIAALGACALSAGVAMAQSGGVTPPSEEPPPASGAPAPAPSSGTSQVHPIPSAHEYGDGFGVARGKGRRHQGVDMFSPCGTPLVAVMNGRIVFNSFHGAAGHYLVLRNKKLKRDYVYMHLRKPGLPKGTKVTMGQWIGSMGDSGNASGCHLHFEIWKGKWYRGGYPINPLPSLQAWDSYS
jgi:murein DD-endopeptidase MepM/ murein hydrolase activator NlpD